MRQRKSPPKIASMLAWLLLLAQHACALVLPPNPSRGRLSCAAAADDDGAARSQFGTKRYWDDMYDGRGDFSSDEYSWYYGWDVVGCVEIKYSTRLQCARTRPFRREAFCCASRT